MCVCIYSIHPTDPFTPVSGSVGLSLTDSHPSGLWTGRKNMKNRREKERSGLVDSTFNSRIQLSSKFRITSPKGIKRHHYDRQTGKKEKKQEKEISV